MKSLPWRWGWLLCVLAALGGCARHAEPPRVKTGAEDTAQKYFEALVAQDWATAYATLDADSKAACSSDQFARLAQAYYQGLGFEPSEVHVQTCDERGDEAIAHVNLKGVTGSSLKVTRDAVALRRGDHGWAVILPESFGKARGEKHG